MALLAELPSEEALRAAVKRVRAAGYAGALDAFTPYAISGIEEEMGLRRPPVSALLVPGGLVGGLFGYLLQRWTNVNGYRINVGAHPHVAAPAFVIITFETAVLVTSLLGFVLLFVKTGLPRLHQPLFQVEGFERSSLNRFWLAMDTSAATFDRDRLIEELRALGAGCFAEVEQEGVP